MPYPISGPADTSSLNSLLQLPYSIVLSPQTSAIITQHTYQGYLLSLYLIHWLLPGGRGCGHLIVAFPLGLGWCLAGTSKGTKGKNIRGGYHPFLYPSFTTSQTCKGLNSLAKWACTPFSGICLPGTPNFPNTLSTGLPSECPGAFPYGFPSLS